MSEPLSPFAAIFVVTFFGGNQIKETQSIIRYLVRELETVHNELQQVFTQNSLLRVLLAINCDMLFPYALVNPFRVNSFFFSRELNFFRPLACLISALMFW